MLYVDLSAVSDPEQGKAADLIVPVSADGGFGVSDQAAGIDQSDLSSLECSVPELVCVPEDDKIGIPDSCAHGQKGDVRNLVFLAVCHEDAVNGICRPFEGVLRERESFRQVCCTAAEKSGKEGGKAVLPDGFDTFIFTGNSVVAKFGHFTDHWSPRRSVAPCMDIAGNIDQQLLGVVRVEIVIVIPADHVAWDIADSREDEILFCFQITGDQDCIDMIRLTDGKADVVRVSMDVRTDQKLKHGRLSFLLTAVPAGQGSGGQPRRCRGLCVIFLCQRGCSSSRWQRGNGGPD